MIAAMTQRPATARHLRHLRDLMRLHRDRISSPSYRKRA